MKENTKDQSKKMNPILWFLFAIVIPLIIVVILAVIIMGVAGFNVMDWAKDKGNTIPIISDMVTTDDEKAAERDEQQVKAALDSKDNEIIELNRNISDLEATIQLLEQEILKLENSQQTAEDVEDTSTEENSEDERIDIVIRSYEEMKSKQAALILQNMENDTAVLILQGVSNEVRGDILEAMAPENAAEFTQLLLTEEN
ncbi:MotE family protein [Oceanobacillus saliphilus]|uniref:MotE family protein n=1 Tax=Oceanobacillus saliphilus TaxID=2925834 RepID=UPI00201DF307|nr:hypothetical protein [Oceanobacillus saliphilus]